MFAPSRSDPLFSQPQDLLLQIFRTIAPKASFDQRLLALGQALKAWRKSALTQAEHFLRTQRKKSSVPLPLGLTSAHELASAHDAMLCALFETLAQDLPFEGTLLAVGGYGRGQLAPYSDLDLLFLLPSTHTGKKACFPLVEAMIPVLWDAGLTLGHAVRTVAESLILAKKDHTIATSLLEARFLCGNEDLAHDLRARLRPALFFRPPLFSSVLPSSFSEPEAFRDVSRMKAFVALKLDERDQRHEKSGHSRYLVEPDVKNSKGGLRDLHTLFWLAHCLFGDCRCERLISEGIFTPQDAQHLKKCEDFLWTIRHHLHFLSQRPENRLSFPLQLELAHRLGYRARIGAQAVERFMRHYFLVAKEVGDLTRIFCSALEAKHLKNVPAPFDFLTPLLTLTKTPFFLGGPFCMKAGRLSVLRSTVFQENPLALLEIFSTAERHGLSIHPEALALMRRSVPLITPKFRKDRRANALFLDLLTRSSDPEKTLRALNETELLGRFIPEFGKIVARMQFNRYHHYTIDEHLFRTIGALSTLERGLLKRDHPLETHLATLLTSSERRVLFLACLFHDMAKGGPGDHRALGALQALTLCPRLGATPTETDWVSWLIRHHHLMNETSQTRDLSDPQTILDFTGLVQTSERLKTLFLLSVCDLKAVGPEIWNPWKQQLLVTLYHSSERVLSCSDPQTERERIHHAKRALIERMPSKTKAWHEAYLTMHDDTYWLAHPLERQLRHAQLIDQESHDLTMMAVIDEGVPFMELLFCTNDASHIAPLLTGACAFLGIDIIHAFFSTTRTHKMLNTLIVARKFADRTAEQRHAQKLEDHLKKRLTLPFAQEALPDSPSLPSSDFSPPLSPQVIIDHDSSDHLTLIQITAQDRRGLLRDLTQIFFEYQLRLVSAKIATFGEKAIDTFYITTDQGEKIERDDILETSLHATLLAACHGTNKTP